MTGQVFVDTNVFVYARDGRDPARHAAARAWVDALWRDRSGRTSTQVLSEFYQTVTRKLRPVLPAEEAWADVRALLSWNPQPIDSSVLADARELEARYRLGWWDALVAAAANRQACDILLSEDFQDGMLLGAVRVMNPFAHRVGEQAAIYAAQPHARPVHRGRGRPRKVAAG